jgi:hypothetical protein
MVAAAGTTSTTTKPSSASSTTPTSPSTTRPPRREFQNVAKLRLNVLFAGSTEGAHRACVLLGIVATCRAVGVPSRLLAWAFERWTTESLRPRPQIPAPSSLRVTPRLAVGQVRVLVRAGFDRALLHEVLEVLGARPA